MIQKIELDNVMEKFNSGKSIILLDAMGVIYQSGDDVGELLIPLIHTKGSQASDAEIEKAYYQASLGQLTATQFWQTVGLSSQVEDEYLSLHQLNQGFNNFLNYVIQEKNRVACLSNDVSEWSKKLRVNFELDSYIQDWIISGDVGIRKPDPNIYQLTATLLNVQPQHFIFIDDRLKNIEAAHQVGFQTILFTREKVETKLRVCSSFAELTEMISIL